MPVPNTPFMVTFEVTARCNLNCSYCWAKPFSGAEPTLEELKFLFTKTKDEAHPFNVVLLGGEPFARHDILDLLRLAKDTFGSYGISTNGTYLHQLSDTELDVLRSCVTRRTIQVSLDSIDPRINDLERGGTMEVLEGLHVLDSASIPFSIAMVLTRSSIRSLARSLDYLLSRFQMLETINLIRLMPSQVMGGRYFLERPTATDYQGVREVASLARSTSARGGVEVRVLGDPVQEGGPTMVDEEGISGCLAGVTSADVLANGDVSPCLMLRNTPIGNLFDQSWSEIWKQSRELVARESPQGHLPRWCEKVNVGSDLLRLEPSAGR